MANKQLLLGDEAVALGALHAGLSGVYAYPGTPSTEITEFIQAHPLSAERGIHSRWCTNEKTAMEAALGMSYAGKRALVCMKHVGMNVCADAFVNSAVTGVNGGVVASQHGKISKADYYTIEHGVNDWGHCVKVGTLADYENNASNKTFYATFEISFSYNMRSCAAC